MYRALRRAGWALAAAAGLGLVAPGRTLARPPLPAAEEIIEMGPEALGPVIVQDHVVATPDAHFTTIDVELAWLADPMTFPYHLGVHVEGGTAHLRGFVQNKAVRERAVRLARQHCMLEVIDELKIHPSMVIPVMAPAVPLKSSEAEAALQEILSSQTASFHVTCRSDGQVRVTGTVPSLEDKLAVSRRLRAMSNCTAVINELQAPNAPSVRAMPRTVQNRTQQPTRAGTYNAARPNARPMPVGAPTAGMMTSAEQPTEPWIPATQAFKNSDTQVGHGPAAPEPASSGEATAGPMVPNTNLLAQLQGRVEGVCGKAATDIHLVPKSRKDLLIQFTARDDNAAALLSEKILTLPELARYHVDLDVKVPEDVPTPAPTSPAPTTSLAPPPAPPRESPAPVTSQIARPPVPSSKATPPAVSQASRPPVSLPSASSPAAELSPVAPPPPAPVSLVSMNIPAEPLPPNAAPALPEPPRPPSIATASPKVAEKKTPPFANNQPAAPRKMEPVDGAMSLLPARERVEAKTGPAATPPAPSPARLKECIVRACGRAASEVHVQLRSPGKVVVQFKASDEKEGEQLAAKVMALPELAAYHVDLDVSVADQPVPPPALTSVAWHPAAVPATDTVGTIKETAASAAVPAVAPAPKATSPRPAEGSNGSNAYATTGVVVVSEPVAVPGRHGGSLLPAGLQERLQSACGSRAEVHAVARSATNLRIELKARSAAEAERLTNVLLNLPELRPFKVDVDVTLVP